MEDCILEFREEFSSRAVGFCAHSTGATEVDSFVAQVV